MGIGFREWLLIACVLLLFFGAKRIPEIAGALGKGIKAFKKAGEDEPAADKKDMADNKDQDKKKSV